MWFNLAASRMTGDLREDAVRGRDIIAMLMPPEDRSKAQRLAREWDAAHPREPETRPVESPGAKRCARHVYRIDQEIRNYAESNIGPDGNNYR